MQPQGNRREKKVEIAPHLMALENNQASEMEESFSGEMHGFSVTQVLWKQVGGGGAPMPMPI